MSDLKQIRGTEFLTRPGLPKKTTLTVYVLCFALIVFFVWACFFNLSVYVKGTGEMIYDYASIHKVEANAPGEIKSIYVNSGQYVEKGQPLVRVDDPKVVNTNAADVYKLASLHANIARLDAVIQGGHFSLSSSFRQKYPEIAMHQKNLFDINHATLNEVVFLIKKNKAQVQKELNMIQPLVDKGSLADIERIRLENRLSDLDVKSADMINRFKKTASEERSKLSKQAKILEHDINTQKHTLTSHLLTAPVSGYAHHMKMSKLGEQVSSGDTVLEVLPMTSKSLVHVEVAPENIASVKVGSKVSLHVTAYPYAVYGDLPGEVTSIAQDSSKRKNGTTYFLVTVKALKNSIEYRGKSLPVDPGMKVEAFIQVSQMRLVTYVFKPLIKSFVDGFV